MRHADWCRFYHTDPGPCNCPRRVFLALNVLIFEQELRDLSPMPPPPSSANAWGRIYKTLDEIKAHNRRLAIFHASEDMIDAIKLLLKEGKTETAVRNAEYVLSRAMPPHLYK